MGVDKYSSQQCLQIEKGRQATYVPVKKQLSVFLKIALFKKEKKCEGTTIFLQADIPKPKAKKKLSRETKYTFCNIHLLYDGLLTRSQSDPFYAHLLVSLY